jgi:hypothetical protein
MFTYPQSFSLPSSAGIVSIRGAGAICVTANSTASLNWSLDWQGYSGTPPAWSAARTRDPAINLDIPVSAFTAQYAYTVAFRPNVAVGATPLATGDWITVTLLNPSPPANPSPYWNVTLTQGSVLQAFGSFPGAVIIEGPDLSGRTAQHAQKTDPAKVDVDRPPLINPTTNPSLDFTQDGLTSSYGDDAEDTDLHPRNFIFHPFPPVDRAWSNHWAFAEINVIGDLRFTRLAPPPQGQTPAYNDINAGISGRDINAPGEPVRVFTAIGGRFANQGISGGNGFYRISAGANPGADSSTAP